MHTYTCIRENVTGGAHCAPPALNRVKAGDTYYPLPHCPLTPHPHRLTVPWPTYYDNLSTLLCSTLYKPYISRTMLTPTTQRSTAHSPITPTNPPYPQTPPTAHILCQYLNFMMFYIIQTIYFPKAGDTHYPLIMTHIDDVDILQHCSPTGPSNSRFGIFKNQNFFSVQKIYLMQFIKWG